MDSSKPDDINPPTNPDEVFKKRVAQLDYYYDHRTSSHKYRKPKKDQAIRHHKYAVIARRLLERGEHRGIVVDIKSPLLCEVLLDMHKGVEDLELSRREPQATNRLMYYSYDGLRERLATEQERQDKNEALITDIQAGIFYVEKYMEKELADIKQMLSQRETSFDCVWALFFPNSLVYTYNTVTKQDMVLIVRRSRYRSQRSDSDYDNAKEHFEVTCDIIKSDGDNFGFAKHTFEIRDFRGTKPIIDLPVYPLSYHKDQKEIYSRAVELGKRYVELPVHCFRELRVNDPNEPETQESGTRVMISPYAYLHYNHLAVEGHGSVQDNEFVPGIEERDKIPLARPLVRRFLSKEGLTDDQYAICTPILLGFAFDRNTWGLVAHSRLHEIQWNDAAFDALVLGERQKELIHSLVSQHSKRKTDFDDIISGKGKGLVGLLAGTPGCGKTLTAEAVAEVTHRPLYVLGAGELGTKPETLEKRLVSVFELTRLWNAVLLLDEAEVFLQQRSLAHLDRNALVSIFLRRLEYYRGILILTTNMPEQCDRAFESRIHFSVHYRELDAAARKSIWETFFKRAAIEISDEDLGRLALHPINGRQIKNAFSSALTISQAHGSPGEKILEKINVVLGVLNEWQHAIEGSSGGQNLLT